MNKQCSIDCDHICLRVITLYKKNCVEMVSSIIRIHSIWFHFWVYQFSCVDRYSIDVERLSNNKSNKNNLLSVWQPYSKSQLDYRSHGYTYKQTSVCIWLIASTCSNFNIKFSNHQSTFLQYFPCNRSLQFHGTIQNISFMNQKKKKPNQPSRFLEK